MKKIPLTKINVENILDLMYEPDKGRYSVLEYHGVRKQITKQEFDVLTQKFQDGGTV